MNSGHSIGSNVRPPLAGFLEVRGISHLCQPTPHGFQVLRPQVRQTKLDQVEPDPQVPLANAVRRDDFRRVPGVLGLQLGERGVIDVLHPADGEGRPANIDVTGDQVPRRSSHRTDRPHRVGFHPLGDRPNVMSAEAESVSRRHRESGPHDRAAEQRRWSVKGLPVKVEGSGHDPAEPVRPKGWGQPVGSCLRIAAVAGVGRRRRVVAGRGGIAQTTLQDQLRSPADTAVASAGSARSSASTARVAVSTSVQPHRFAIRSYRRLTGFGMPILLASGPVPGFFLATSMYTNVHARTLESIANVQECSKW